MKLVSRLRRWLVSRFPAEEEEEEEDEDEELLLLTVGDEDVPDGVEWC